MERSRDLAAYYFSARHLVCFQVAIAGRLRWRAWPIGCCTLQLIKRSGRQTDVFAKDVQGGARRRILKPLAQVFAVL